MDNEKQSDDAYGKYWQYGPLKNDIIHLDQIIENKVAHHHIKYKGKKFYVKITNKSWNICDSESSISL